MSFIKFFTNTLLLVKTNKLIDQIKITGKDNLYFVKQI